MAAVVASDALLNVRFIYLPYRVTPAVQLQNHPDCIIFHSAAGKGGGGKGGGGKRGGCCVSLQSVMLDGDVTQSERKLDDDIISY